jgi:hypothetical protein
MKFRNKAVNVTNKYTITMSVQVSGPLEGILVGLEEMKNVLLTLPKKSV